MIYYTNDRNIQILISVLKHNNIRKIIASPGTTNMAFVASIQHDSFFEIYSCVDERSACYMATGLSVESGEPVVITCTGATASRNYIPGLTEAFYRKIPILAVTCAQHFSKIDNNIPQTLDRTSQLKDMVNMSVQIPVVNSYDDELGCNILINKAILELNHRGGGPVHINIVTTSESNKNFDTKVLPNTRYIERLKVSDKFPIINGEKVAIFVGSHKIWNKELTHSVEKFCEIYNSVVICDQTSNYHGKYKIMPNIIFDQDKYTSSLNSFDIIIHIGDVSGSYLNLNTKKVWRVNPDGKITDTFFKLSNVFEMEEKDFFEKYTSNAINNKKIDNFLLFQKEYIEFEEKANKVNLPFSNIWIAMNTINLLPENCYLYLSILNSLRSWNYFMPKKNLFCYSNTGGFGIDGSLSTLIGASLVNPNNLYFGIIGDLSFFYDINALGNKNIKNNIRIILINNGCGTEFHNYSHPASKLGEMANDYIAANGHFGNKSPNLVKNFVESLDFEYLAAKNKEEFLNQIDYFSANKKYEKSLIFEIFTDSSDESEALRTLRNLKLSSVGVTKDITKKILNDSMRQKIKKIIKK